MEHARKRSDDFLELVRRSRQGRLKVFLGPAAGVGKTYRMLQEAHELVQRGVDVVIGVIDTHGRAETAALLEGLEEVPLRKVAYRGVELEELDVDAVKERAPTIALIDEVAHTNAPGSKHKKRYEDILELLRAGIHVYCALNIQHLESLNDVVKRATHVKVHETVPDSFLRRADQIVNIDLPAGDLLERLEAGKVYPKDRIDWALRHFFQRDNLEGLRELALREVAEAIGRSQSRDAESPAESRGTPRPTGGRLMLCLSSRSPRARALIRRASRMAGRLNVHWYAVYVETPRRGPEAHRRGDPAAPLRRPADGAEPGRGGVPHQGRRSRGGHPRVRAGQRRHRHHHRCVRAALVQAAPRHHLSPASHPSSPRLRHPPLRRPGGTP